MDPPSHEKRSTSQEKKTMRVLMVILMCFAIVPNTTMANLLISTETTLTPFVESLVQSYAYADDQTAITLQSEKDVSSVLTSAHDLAFLMGPTNAQARQIPIGLYGIQAFYNMPSLSCIAFPFGTLCGIPTVATMLQLAQIYSQANATLSQQQTQPFVFVVHNHTDPTIERASLTGVFARALAQADPQGFGTLYEKSGGLLANTLAQYVLQTPIEREQRLITVDPSDPTPLVQVASMINSSITYGVYSTTTTTPPSIETFLIKGYGGTAFSQPTQSSVQQALIYYLDQMNPMTNQGLALEISNAQSLTAWPLSGIVFASINTTLVPVSKCAYISKALALIAWSQTNQAAIALATGSPVWPLTNGGIQKTLQSMGYASCDNETALLLTDYFLGQGPPTNAWITWANAYSTQSGSLGSSNVAISDGSANAPFKSCSSTTTTPSLNQTTMAFSSSSKTNQLIVEFSQATIIEAVSNVQTGETNFAGVPLAGLSNNNNKMENVLPLGIRGVGCAVGANGKNSADASNGLSLSLSLEILADILTNDILWWNDSRITSLGNNMAFLEQTFTSAQGIAQPICFVLDQGGNPTISGGPLGGMASQALLMAILSIRPLLYETVITSNDGVLEWPIQTNTVIETFDNASRALLAGGQVASTLTYQPPTCLGCDFVDLIQQTRSLSLADFIIMPSSSSSSNQTGSVFLSSSLVGDYLMNALNAWPNNNPTNVDSMTFINQPSWLLSNNTNTTPIIHERSVGHARSNTRIATRSSTTTTTTTCSSCWPMGVWTGMVLAFNSTDCQQTTALLDWAWWLGSSFLSSPQSPYITLSSNLMAQSVLLQQIAQVDCNGYAAFSLFACLIENDAGTASICSNHGTCQSSVCFCDSGWTGSFCEQQQQQQDQKASSFVMTTAQTIGVAVGSIFGGLLVVILLAIVLILILILQKRSKDQRQRIERAVLIKEEVACGRMIGSGPHARVYKGLLNCETVAVKRIIRPSFSSKKRASSWEKERNKQPSSDSLFLSEWGRASCVRDGRIVRLMGVKVAPTPTIITEYLAIGSLYELIHNDRVPVFPFRFMLEMACDLAKAMRTLHRHGMLHCNLKSTNVFLSNDEDDARWHVKIADAGLIQSLGMTETDAASEDQASCIAWMAPELLRHRNGLDDASSCCCWTMKSDVYSFGIILWELLTRRLPFENLPNFVVVAQSVVKKRFRPDGSHSNKPCLLLEAASSSSDDDSSRNDPNQRLSDLGQGGEQTFKRMIVECWSDQPDERPSFESIVSTFENVLSLINPFSKQQRAPLRTSESFSSYTASDESVSIASRRSERSYAHDDGDDDDDDDDDDGKKEEEDEYSMIDLSSKNASKRQLIGKRKRGNQRKASYVTPIVMPDVPSAWFGADVSGSNGLFFAISDVVEANEPWTSCPEKMKDAMKTYNRIVRDLLDKHGGCESVSSSFSSFYDDDHHHHDDDSDDYDNEKRAPPASMPHMGTFFVAFGTAHAAIAWACDLQKAIRDWNQNKDTPLEMKEKNDPQCWKHPDSNKSNKNENRLQSNSFLFKKRQQQHHDLDFKARVGIHWGFAECTIDIRTGKRCYFGQGLMDCVRVAAVLAGPNQIVVTKETLQRLDVNQMRLSQGDLFFAKLSKKSTVMQGGFDDLVQCFEIIPTGFLSTRKEKEGLIDESLFIGLERLPSLLEEKGSCDHDEDEEDDISQNGKTFPFTDCYTGLGSTNLCSFLIDFKSLFIEKEIAHDSQGTLYKATWKKHHQPIAVKRLYHPGRASEDLLLDTIHEASCLSIVEHSNVVVFLGVCLHQNDVYVVTEFLPTLSDLILESPVRSMESRVDMLCGAAKGLAHLHSLGIACGGCGSIKSDNIFLDVSDQDLCRSVKIGGFGFERIKREGAVTSFCDSFAWTPPEMLLGEPFVYGGDDDDDDMVEQDLAKAKRMDVFSFGVIMWQLALWTMPCSTISRSNKRLLVDVSSFACNHEDDQKEGDATAAAAASQNRFKIPQDVPFSFVQLMNKCLNKNPMKRPCMKQVETELTQMLIIKQKDEPLLIV